VAKDFAELRTVRESSFRRCSPDARQSLSVSHRDHHPNHWRTPDSSDFEIAQLFEPSHNTCARPERHSGVHLPAGAGAARGSDHRDRRDGCGRAQRHRREAGADAEPLLATPLKTGELLAAKVISAAIPGVVLTTSCFALYVVLVAILALQCLDGVADSALARAGVPHRSAGCTVGLQIAVYVVSSQRSARAAAGSLLIIPVGVLQVAQFVGGVVLTAPILLAIGAARRGQPAGAASCHIDLRQRTDPGRWK
jgi:hypothetical protein